MTHATDQRRREYVTQLHLHIPTSATQVEYIDLQHIIGLITVVGVILTRLYIIETNANDT